MALERKWLAVTVQPLTSNGTTIGIVTLASTAGYHTKTKVSLTSSALEPLALQVQQVISATQLIVGPVGPKVGREHFIDISAYLTADHAALSAAEQDKSNIPEKDHYVAIYEADPIIADRVIQVDRLGNFYDETNPMPVAVSGGTFGGEVGIKYGNNHLKVNPDGSINVNVITSLISTNNNVVSNYGEITSVVPGSTTEIISYTVPAKNNTLIERLEVSGENIARFQILVNGTVKGTVRTYYGGDLNATMDFLTDQENGLVLVEGDVISITVLHNQTYVADFEARLQVLEILKINPDGSHNEVTIPSTNVDPSGDVVFSIYGEANSVPGYSTAQVISYTVPIGKTSLIQKVELSGENVSKYQILINGIPKGTFRTYFGGSLNATFDFLTGQDNGFIARAGDVVSITTRHGRTMSANFEARIQVLQITNA